MSTTEITRHCIALGGLDGVKFTEVLTNLRSELERLETLVSGLAEESEVAPPPIHSVGHEVDRDAAVIDHLGGKLADAMSGLIDLLAMTRMARVTLESAM